ncbi:hypothetical protein WICMUC_003229 [Wickerhamomyces mucosus]|uniref:Enoyl reductase (ER) domain-containing protein n=1 Tax=Wickerhamomyces mucosus TaxID=1378264 RepID=A0A9P8PM39_9ASCO|nr:hypothetical protein WICMUC_003229 [Wickerhamomyces mucosus]
MSEAVKVLQNKQVGYNYNQPINIEVKSLDITGLKPNEVVIKIVAAAINPVDLIIYNSHPFIFFARGRKEFGRDFSGIIIHKGSNVQNFEINDQISGILDDGLFNIGSFQEYIRIDISRYPNLGKIPKNLSLTEAASFPLVFGTAWTLFTHNHKPTESSRALVIGGATSVGNYAIQLLKNYYNVKSIISINSSKSSEFVKNSGVDQIVDYTANNVANDVLSIVETQYNGEKLDIIVDTVGNNELFPIIDKILKPKSENSGYYTIVGDQIGDYNKSFSFFHITGVLKKLFFPKSFNYSFSSIQKGGWYEKAVELFEQKKIKVNINKVVKGLENYQILIDELKDHKSQGKLVLQVSELD